MFKIAISSLRKLLVTFLEVKFFSKIALDRRHAFVVYREQFYI